MTTLKNPCVLKLLDCSLAHIPKTDETLLDDGYTSTNPLTVYCLDHYGYLVYVGDYPEDSNQDGYFDEIKAHGYSESLCQVLITAIATGCDWVKFDMDGTTYPELESFVWSEDP